MPTLTIVAQIHASSDQIEFVKSDLFKLIPVARAEARCVTYDLHQDTEDLRRLSPPAWQQRRARSPNSPSAA
ncbi:putative quinol monooxygenase [Tropicimonas aquimaris]|uniref:Quinol monooxygenase n=1 Tax=Tropicimonas aquimaris TaxID=914152 RepID=A0ABW3IUU8_9RHOB